MTDALVEKVARAMHTSDVLASFDGIRVENPITWEREAEEDRSDYRRQAAPPSQQWTTAGRTCAMRWANLAAHLPTIATHTSGLADQTLKQARHGMICVARKTMR